MQTTQKDIIFKIIDSLMKYMDKQALLGVKLAFLLVELAGSRLLTTSLLACVQTTPSP